jgi:hypothetical protein
MSDSKHSILKGLKNPNSKKPAAEGPVRSISSPISPAVGNVSRGGYQPPPVFVSAIFTIVLAWLKSIRTYLPKEQIQNFATEYATANPPKGTKRLFEQLHVDAALVAFQESFQPPALSPPPPIHHYDKGDNMFRSIMQKGISSETIGIHPFQQFLALKPLDGFIWVFTKCPSLRDLQRGMCFRDPLSLTTIGVFMAGFWIGDDGAIHFMKQNTNMHEFDPSHPTGIKAAVWPFCLGNFVHRRDYAHEGEQPSGHDSLYDRSGNYHGSGSSVGAFADAEKRCSELHVPRILEQLTHGRGDGERIQKNAQYREACQAAMAKLGGTPVFKFSTSVSKEATKAESDEAVPSKCPDFCTHDVFRGGQEIGLCRKCDWGE